MENLKNVKIVEYKEKYAASIAEMWNRSSEGWQGDHWNKTEESVKTGEASSTHLKLYLAVIEEEVIGYCKISKFENDKNTWYIDLINVRPDYYGKKIGKALLLKSTDYAIEKGMPRVDLHTWSGNLKAVPLYKKCGYFWIDQDNTTHLINLIPKVLKMDLFKDFFQKVDWYNDNARDIEVKPDGTKDGEFEYWTYSWKKDDEMLEIDFCRRGRGIRRIETKDYKITASVKNRKLIFGSDYKINYEFENKSGKQLEIKMESQNCDMIKFDYQNSFIVKDKKMIEPTFFIEKIDDIVESERTQPNVVSKIFINGKSVLFETGISPQFPVHISIRKENDLFKNEDNECFINLQNMDKDEIDLTINLKPDGNIKFSKETLQIKLKGKEKKTLKNSFIFDEAGLYQNEVEMKINKNGNEFTFSKDIEFYFLTMFDKYYSSHKSGESISFGKYYLTLIKKNEKNCLFFSRIGELGGFFFPVPSFGKPFNEELVDTEPIFESRNEENSIHAKITFESKKYSGAKLIYNFELFHNGTLTMFVEVDKANWNDELFAVTYLWFPKANAAIMQDNRIMRIPENNTENPSSLWNYDKISEQWLFSKTEGSRRNFSMIWNDDFKFSGGSWKNTLENYLPKDISYFKSKNYFFSLIIFLIFTLYVNLL